MATQKVTEDTPLVKQYFAVKAQNPEAVLLYRVGDFYETYSDDAITASKVLGLVLTKRSNGDKGSLPMAGFPHHAIDAYLPKLVRAGYKVAVCDQLEDPKLAGRRLVKRGVTDLVTPGVTFNENLLEQKEHNFIAALYFEKKETGAAFLDVSTGTFRVAQGDSSYIGTLLSDFAPKEWLVQRGCEKVAVAQYGEGAYVSSVEEWAFVYESAVERLCRQFGTESLKGFAIDSCPLGVCAAGALLVYLGQTHHDQLGNICSISRIDEGKFVWMDRFTMRNLEVFQSSAGGEGVPLVSVIDHCASPLGARLLRSWLAMPVMDTGELESRYEGVQYFLDNKEVRETVREAFGNIGDLERIISRAATGRISPREVRQLGRGLSLIGPVRELLSTKGNDTVRALAGRLDGSSSLAATIKKTIAEDSAAQLGKGPVIARGFSKELDDLRDASAGGKDYLVQMQVSESERTGIPSLKIGYNNVFGYYLEVRNTYKDKVPPEWVRKQTLVSAERYITEELKDYEEKILGAEDNILALETRIYQELVAEIQKHIRTIQSDAETIARIDVLAGFADLSEERHYCRPVVDDSNSLEIKGARHPVIETLMKPGEEYVPNDIRLDGKSQQIIILTGPNMSGKSALLRQTALIVLMAQSGCFVPATSARFGYFDKIFTRVGATDNISRGESTFMVEMLETSMILNNLSSRSLVLLDEIGRGTSTYDGMSIARAIVEYIHEYGKGAKTLFATHYHELNDLEGNYKRVKNFHIAVKEAGKEVIFLRKLEPGGSDRSFGIHVARMAGMPKEVIESAEKTLSALEAEDTAGKKLSAAKSYGTIKKAFNVPEGTVESDGSLQLSLFQLADPELESLRDTLRGTDLNNMTPLQAFDLLRSMKKQLGL